MTANNQNQIPQGRTAIVVIHGIGQQNILESLDNFTRGLVRFFNNKNLQFEASHQIRRGANASDEIKSFIRLSSTNNQQDYSNNKQENWLIDIHEYYWAYQTEAKIQMPELLQWINQTLQGNSKFYQQQDKLKNQRKFPLKNLAWCIYAFSLLYPLFRIITWCILTLINLLPIGSFFKSTWRLSKTLIIPSVVGYVGDIAIYTTIDRKSSYYNVRQQILAESQAFIEAILKDKEGQYEQVIIAGHSLGSVIAYDTLNCLCIKTSLLLQDKKEVPPELQLDKLKGLITFGSPLDKIAFFLREKVENTQYVRQRIVEHLNSFRVKPLVVADKTQLKPFFCSNPVCYQLQHINWFNYYHRKDPISGHLDCYENLNNIGLDFKAFWPSKAHGGYWSDDKFFDGIAKNFLYKTEVKTPTSVNTSR